MLSSGFKNQNLNKMSYFVNTSSSFQQKEDNLRKPSAPKFCGMVNFPLN
jgi:hypothetical protein